MPKEKLARDFSIDILKFIAVFLIINSHADIAYVKFCALATGGAIGDCIFLFCSGFTLFLGKSLRFDNYYKRRINRIYPSVFASIIVLSILGFYNFSNLSLRNFWGGEFVIAIMFYYILLWVVKEKFVKKTFTIFLTYILICAVGYYFFPYKGDVSINGIYGISTKFRWLLYIGIMLIGAYVGKNRENIRFSLKLDIPMFIICMAVFYGIQLLAKVYPSVGYLQIVTVPFLFGIVFYLYKICNSNFCRNLYESKVGNLVIMLLGGLCLESYLVNGRIITDKFNFMFPFNLPLVFLLIFVVAYVTRCLSRLILQTFRTEDYEWKKIFRI